MTNGFNLIYVAHFPGWFECHYNGVVECRFTNDKTARTFSLQRQGGMPLEDAIKAAKRRGARIDREHPLPNKGYNPS